MTSLITQKNGIFSQKYRALTIGIILAVTSVAFEGLAVTTIAPVLAEELRGVELYGWVFSAYLLAQLTGTVVAGQQIDKQGFTLPSIMALVLFGTGLVIAAIAPTMPILIAGRALQGFGSGALINCVYTSINLRYEDSLQTQILAIFSTAYVLPALIGPYVAGVIAERTTWRLVFWGILPFLALAALLTLPTFRQLTAKSSGERNQSTSAIQLAVGTGLLLVGFGQLPKAMAVFLALGGVVLVVLSLRRLLPAGTLVARSGLPAIIASRGLLMASYLGTETFIVFALKAVKGYTAETAGLVVASGALSWTTAAWLQARLDRQDEGQGRRGRVLIGVTLMVVGIAVGTQVVWVSNFELAIAVGGQILAGFGIGLAHITSTAIAFTYAKDGAEGKVSADLQIADTFTPALSIGIGGAVVAINQSAGWAIPVGVTAALGIQFLLIIISLLAAYRLPISAPPKLH